MEKRAFHTNEGVRVTAVTADEMRDVDRVAVEDVGLDLLQMMENAGRTLARHVRSLKNGSVLVVAGNGGNGGGGLACARHLANHDVDVTVALDRDPRDLTGVTAQQYGILEEMHVPTVVGPEQLEDDEAFTVLVDALIGYGLSGPVREPTARLIRSMNRHSASILSLDVPSGIDATSGETLGIAADPDRILTLALPKTGLREQTCSLFLADISVPHAVYERLDIEYVNPFGEEMWVELAT